MIHVAQGGSPAVLLRTSVAVKGMQIGLIGFPPAATFTVPPTYPYGSVAELVHGATDPRLPTGSVPLENGGDADLVQVDAFAEPGDSGGPIVDEAASVVGLESFGPADSRGPGRAEFSISAGDIQTVLSQAGVVNALGTGDDAWRAGLLAFDRGDMEQALSRFRECEQASPANLGCREWDARVAARQQPAASGHGTAIVISAVFVAASAGAAALLVWLIRRRRTRDRRRLFRA